MTADDGVQRFVRGVEGGPVRGRRQALQGHRLQRAQHQGDVMWAGDQLFAPVQQRGHQGERGHSERQGQAGVLVG